MQTLRRELIQTIRNTIIDAGEFSLEVSTSIAEKVADSILELRAFHQSEQAPEHSIKRGSEEWKKKLREELSGKSVEGTIYFGGQVKQEAIDEQIEIRELEDMIDKELSRLPYNWSEDGEKEKERFRNFLKKESGEGRQLEKWVDWWMSDEWRVANPPWKLQTIRVKWLEAFQESAESEKPESESPEDGEIHI